MPPTLPVKDSDIKITVGKILCLGLNYARHVEEMDSKKPKNPVVFLKPATAIVQNGGIIKIPTFSNNVHHEIELVAVIGKNGRNIKPENADHYILGYALGLDITLRDVQAKAKENGHPWAVAKGFDTSAPISEIILKEGVDDLNHLSLKLWVNNQIRQDGNTKDMILKLPDIVSFLSNIFTLERGDLIFTGTPEGVSRISSGDRLTAQLNHLLKLELSVV